MKETRLIMGMPITVEIVDATATREALGKVFDYFAYVDEKFSTYKKTSEITKINEKVLKKSEWSKDMKLILTLCGETRQQTAGYFDIVNREGLLDPSGLVKGWSIWKATKLLEAAGYKNFFIEAGGDMQVRGSNAQGSPWRIGIRNPLSRQEIVKVVQVASQGVATSGTYIRGQHIYNPKQKEVPLNDILSLTVIGPNVYEADRFATAAFAMGVQGVDFIERLEGFEGYSIDKNGRAMMTSGFQKYTP